MADDELRAATANGMDAYFQALTEGAEREVSPGEMTMGYRFVYESPSGKLYSPFVFGDMRNAFYIADYERGDFTHGSPRDASDAELLEVREKQFHSKPSEDREGFKVDLQGRGYYYFPEREMAEDYMKAMIFRSHLETNDPKDYYVELESGERIDRRFMYDMPKMEKAWDEANADKNNLGIVDMRSTFNTSLPYEHVKNAGGFALNHGKVRLSSDALRGKQEGDKVAVTIQSTNNEYVYAKGTLKKQDMGRLVMYRVEGKAVENIYNDAGFIMNEMLYREEVLSIPLTDIYKQFNERN